MSVLLLTGASLFVGSPLGLGALIIWSVVGESNAQRFFLLAYPIGIIIMALFFLLGALMGRQYGKNKNHKMNSSLTTNFTL